MLLPRSGADVAVARCSSEGGDAAFGWETADHTRTGELVMGQLIDEIITLLALGDTRHPKE